jgi:ribosomal protein L7Ae-like RNA K-turn-binding protein
VQKDKILNLVGLAMKAGKVVGGEFMTEKAVKTGAAHLVIVAGDASGNTQKKFRNMCDFYQVPLTVYGDKDTLGHAMGKEMRASLAVTDEGLAKAIVKKMD